LWGVVTSRHMQLDAMSARPVGVTGTKTVVNDGTL
jgi:hypothetical protein